MSDKRGDWTKVLKKMIWQDYINQKMWKLFDSGQLEELGWEFVQKAPCPFCGQMMLRAQYQGSQPNKECSWDIDHWDGNPKNNSLINLFPMHPWCNKKKSNG